MNRAHKLDFDTETSPQSTSSRESCFLTAISTTLNTSARSSPELLDHLLEVSTIGDEEVVIASPPMKKLYRLIDRVAMAKFPVLIGGETGSGKELVARALHQRGPFSHGPLKAINCGAIPTTLIESVLFGHERGAFTGAHKKSPGIFEQANGGMVFLDEVGELPEEAQAALLRAIETKRITRLGSNKEIAVNARVIAATNCDLEAMVSDGRFREDLFYRLNTIILEVPPLRERLVEIDALALLFIRKACRNWNTEIRSISTEALTVMRQYSWPGNVRELRNVIERALIFCTGDRIRRTDLPEYISSAPQKSHCVDNSISSVQILPSPGERSLSELLSAYERDLIINALRKTSGNQSKAAERLGIARRTLVNKLRVYGLSPNK
ncbi:MAG: sigma-54-dependent Fis family transcriptional regulator [Proteobacteria bacterium]|nr:sigma-54-dependent Fis family transcriptional regulator [Pseudomonadota bacterium]